MSTDETKARFRLSQETIAILSVGVAIAGLFGITLAGISDIREEARADRAAWQATARADRAAWQAESRQLREEFQRRMEALQRQVVGLSIEHEKLAARVEAQ